MTSSTTPWSDLQQAADRVPPLRTLFADDPARVAQLVLLFLEKRLRSTPAHPAGTRA